MALLAVGYQPRGVITKDLYAMTQRLPVEVVHAALPTRKGSPTGRCVGGALIGFDLQNLIYPHYCEIHRGSG